MMIYVKIQEKASKTRAFITRRVTNFFIFYFLHKSLTEFMVADVFGFVVSRQEMAKKVAQKLRTLDIIGFQRVSFVLIKVFKKLKVSIHEKNRENWRFSFLAEK